MCIRDRTVAAHWRSACCTFVCRLQPRLYRPGHGHLIARPRRPRRLLARDVQFDVAVLGPSRLGRRRRSSSPCSVWPQLVGRVDRGTHLGTCPASLADSPYPHRSYLAPCAHADSISSPAIRASNCADQGILSGGFLPGLELWGEHDTARAQETPVESAYHWRMHRLERGHGRG